MNNDPNALRVENFFQYPVPAIVLAPAAVGSSVLRIESATDFVWFKQSYWADDDPVSIAQTEATRIIPSVDVQVQVSGADKNLFNAPTPIPNIFGTGKIPGVLPKPMVLLANSEVRFDFTSRDTRTLRIVLSLWGLKDYGELQRTQPSA